MKEELSFTFHVRQVSQIAPWHSKDVQSHPPSVGGIYEADWLLVNTCFNLPPLRAYDIDTRTFGALISSGRHFLDLLFVVFEVLHHHHNTTSQPGSF